MRARRKLGCLYLLLAVAAVIATGWLLRVPLLTEAGRLLIENDRPQQAQAVVVLGGDDYGTRTLKAAQLVEDGYAPYAIISGPHALLGPESEEDIEYARRHGYPARLFQSFPDDCSSTRCEAVTIGNYLRAHNIRKILLVTSNYHTRRAARLFRSENPGLQVVVIAAPDPYFSANGWWKSRQGQKTFFFEWSKTIATWAGM